ncbi:Thioredoxin superfamily protein [Striga hermonthica]|uniref:Thioredoxin superfamily protein n=1 Tax=Striga hermonthica TaxID=68872 RepID=A0A9N7NBM8_STRHE|nr:Thioredoxin superfamily protein [Striga hermonthica]
MGLRSKKLSVVLLLLLCLSSPISGQFNIPARPDGLWYGDKRLEPGQILIEAFLDPVCPDSRDSWPPLKKALEDYGDRVKLITAKLWYEYIAEAFFNNQENFYGDSTFNLSRAIITDRIVKFSIKALGDSFQSAIESGFENNATDYLTRVGFKQGCIRGVYATPYFFVNGFTFAEPGSAQNYSTWRNVLDPLVGK